MGGYEVQPRGAPELLPLLSDAVWKCVVEFARVAKGENALILSEFTTDQIVPQTLGAFCAVQGADVTQMQVRPLSPGGYDRENPSAVVLGAYREADVVFSCTYFELAHSKRLFFSEISKYKARVITMLMMATPQALIYGGRFPVPLFRRIAELALRKAEGCRSVRVTDGRGTDLLFDEPDFGGNVYEPRSGSWSIFPLGGLNWYPKNTHGHFWFDESTITGRATDRTEISVENGLVSKIEGGVAADSVRAFANGQYYLRHAHIGLNPKVRFEGAPQFEREKCAGVFYLGLDGLGGTNSIDRSVAGFSHLDCIIDTPTVYFDDEPVIKDRRLLLLDEPEVVEAAREFGDPKRLLAQNHLLW